MAEDKLKQQIAELQKVQEHRDTLQHNIRALESYIGILKSEDGPKYTRTMKCEISINIHDGDWPSTVELGVKKITPAIRDVLWLNVSGKSRSSKRSSSPSLTSTVNHRAETWPLLVPPLVGRMFVIS